jgi:hypothetical protein
MAGSVSFRILTFLLVAAGCGLCQQRDQASAMNSLPDAPSIRTATQTQTLKALVQAARLPLRKLEQAGELAFPTRDQFFDLRTTESAGNTSSVFLQKYFYHTSLSTGRYRPSNTDSFIGRATYAASSILVTHDEAGRSRLNTSYVLGVLTMAAAHSAERPYWRRSMSQPVGDFGSTLGNDAGMNVLHEFSPGIRELVRTHEPRFVSKIEAKINKK